MGYDLHITRAADWMDAEADPIEEHEWKAIVDADPTLTLNRHDFYEYDTPSGKTVRLHPVMWGAQALWCDKGEITAKNPSDKLVAKMKSIAKQLGARVLGDDGESY
jgi:hypothetical protein